MLTIEVPGNPVPKGRPRFSRGRTYTPKRTSDYEANVAEVAAEAMREAGRARTSGRVAVAVVAVLEVPKSYKGRKRTDALFGISYPSGDVDNYAKAALDSLNNLVWEDDKQCVQLTAIKRWGERGALVIEVRYLDDRPG